MPATAEVGAIDRWRRVYGRWPCLWPSFAKSETQTDATAVQDSNHLPQASIRGLVDACPMVRSTVGACRQFIVAFDL